LIAAERVITIDPASTAPPLTMYFVRRFDQPATNCGCGLVIGSVSVTAAMSIVIGSPTDTLAGVSTRKVIVRW
jgi:hypothetical protein